MHPALLTCVRFMCHLCTYLRTIMYIYICARHLNILHISRFTSQWIWHDIHFLAELTSKLTCSTGLKSIFSTNPWIIVLPNPVMDIHTTSIINSCLVCAFFKSAYKSLNHNFLTTIYQLYINMCVCVSVCLDLNAFVFSMFDGA